MSNDNDQRLLVLALTEGDAALSRTILEEAGIGCFICHGLDELCMAFTDGAGAILLTDTALTSPTPSCLTEALETQPAWSDIPVLLLCGSGADSAIAAWAMESINNVTVLERPIRITTLVSTVRTALGARRRQYQLRDQLRSLHNSQQSFRQANDRLGLLWEAAAILLAGDDPEQMLHRLFERIGPQLQLDICFNYMLDEGRNTLRLASYVGVPEHVAESIGQMSFGEAICGCVAIERRPMLKTFIQDSDDPAVVFVKSLGARAYVCNPLIAGEKLLGTLSFASRSLDEFDQQQIALLETITNYVTTVCQRTELVRALRESDQRKDEFLATLAHELRNPLAPIRTGLELLMTAGNDTSMVDEVLATMENQVRHIVRLVDDLMDVSRITKGKLTLRRSTVELQDVVEQAIDGSRRMIDDAHHTLHVVLPNEPVMLTADPTRLTQALSNLLNNAARYTPDGGEITLSAECSADEVAIVVADNGLGIPPEMLENIFEMFTQVDGSAERGGGGLGIGLTLVKSLVEMHGGSITVDSDGAGTGSRFTIRLPLAGTSVAITTETSDTDIAAADNGGLRILVVDDNRDAVKLLDMVISRTGHDVRVAYDGQQAVDAAEDFRPHVVLMDIGMPRLNGFEAAAKIREQSWGKDILLVALTGWGQQQDKRRTAEAGFDHHIVKPVEPAELRRLLADVAGD